MASYFPLFFVGFLVLVVNSDGFQTEMEKEELLGLFEVLGALLDDSSWAQDHPQPCDETPWPGVQCEIGDDQNPPVFHVTKIHIGPDILTPPCKSSAYLSHFLSKLPYLKTLSIFNCFLTSQVTLSPSLLGALSSLEHLALESNPALVGEIPPTLLKITNLRVLSLSQNNLQGKIPSQIGGMVNLEQLDLSYNNLSGQIPREIGGLEALTVLDLSWNVLQGQVPSSVGQLKLIQKIDFSSNRFRGSVPPDLGQLKRLVLLDLSHNFINGPIPEALSGLEQLEYLLADKNPINSEIPQFVGRLMKLKSLSLSGCGLTGQLPSSLSSLKNLTALSLGNNSLTGTVPPSLGTLPSLDQLNLSSNQLSGALSFPMEFIERLGKRLDVKGNNGLCAKNPLIKKTSITFSDVISTPPCLNASGPRDDKALAGEQHPNESQRMKPVDHQYPPFIKSSGSPLSHKKMTSLSFLVCILCLIL